MSSSATELLLRIRDEAVGDGAPEETWYLVAACALAAVGRGGAFGDLYNVVVESQDAQYKTRVSKRLREVLMKAWTLVGLPRAISACYALLAADGQVIDASARYHSLLHDSEKLMANGTAWLAKASRGDEDKVLASLNGQKSMAWLLGLVYGLFLSDLAEFSPTENESVILSSTMCMSPEPLAVTNHMKSARRLGMPITELVALQNICKKISAWAGNDTSKWPRAEEVDQYFDEDECRDE